MVTVLLFIFFQIVKGSGFNPGNLNSCFHSLAPYKGSPSVIRNEKAFDSLVNDMISQDLAMRTVVENAELLIYSSTILPMEYWSEAKYFSFKKLYSLSCFSNNINLIFVFSKLICRIPGKILFVGSIQGKATSGCSN